MAVKGLLIKLGGMVASFGLLVTAINANTNCICFIHQPEMPKGAEKLRKF